MLSGSFIAEILKPLTVAGQALGFVDADQRAALGTCPLLLFVSDEAPYAGGLYFPEIFDHSYAARGDKARGYRIRPCRFCHICIQKLFND
jgi:hypothetical protein